MEILAVEPTILFVGTEERPLQVVQVRLRATEPILADSPAKVSIVGDGIAAEEPVLVGGLSEGEVVSFEVGVAVDGDVEPGTRLEAELVVERATGPARHPFRLVVAEPGWRMFMVSHFHYDPVWWNTQAAYTESWGHAYKFRAPFQEPGFALVKSHLEMARRDADYKFVLAELDYLKPYWDVYPEDRAYIRQLLAEGRLELMGGTYNEPNTNLTSAESTIRNAIYGVAYQRDVLGGNPATAWQLDAFGHDPQFPGIMAGAGISSSSWARGPFHEWGPNWRRGPAMMKPVWDGLTEPPGMQFTTEFDWLSPSGKGVLTSFQADHYSAGWWMDAAPTLEQAEREVLLLFAELQAVAATKNVLLPVGTDYAPPNKWVTAIHRDWNRRYVWPRFISGTPNEFFAAVRAERAKTGRGFSPQTRDMNPIYTGKDVSFIDTKQAQRAAENTLLTAEKFATFASLLGARYPTEAFDKAWRQLLFGAHHDGITGSESDQVYLDLLGGWREAMELSGAALDGALGVLGERIDTSGEGWAVTVFNPLSWPRTDVARAELLFGAGEGAGDGQMGRAEDPASVRGVELRDEAGSAIPFVVEAADRRDDGSLSRIVVAFIARDVPALGYRTYRAVAADRMPEESTWRPVPGSAAIENDFYALRVDAERGGAIASLVERRTGKEILRDGGLGNELFDYEEYQNHPLFGEGPWHLTPTGSKRTSAEAPAEVVVEESPIGRRVRVSGAFADCKRRQDVYLWDGVDRVDFVTQLDDFHGQDRLFRVRFAADVEGGASISEVGNAVVGRGFAFPNADVAEQPFTLDNPAYNWFGVGATARIALVDGRGEGDGGVRAARAISVAEVIVADDPAQDELVRDLMISLVRTGVTATLGRDDGKRYGTLVVDSNMPDVRIVVGGRDDNRLTAAILEAAGPAYADELERQLASAGRARLWVPASRPLADAWRGNADMRELGALPSLIVAGADQARTLEAIEALARDLDDAVITVVQPPELDGTTGRVEDYTVGLLNRGLPGFAVEGDGSLYLSLMRSCSGWPSGVWINPPRRTVPDGSNFQFQHWTHRFEYAVAGGPGDWRQAELVRLGHEYNNPLVTRAIQPHPGELPASSSLVRVEPSSAVLTVAKPTGNPLAHMSLEPMDPKQGVTLRVYESSGRRTRARIISPFLALSEPRVTGFLEEEQPRAADAPVRTGADGSPTIEADLDPFAIVTVAATPKIARFAGGGDGLHPEVEAVSLVPRAEVAQPVFADYWSHNKGPAPMGYLPVSVQIGPGRLAGPGPFVVPVTVASERTDGPAPGTVEIVTPPGWRANPSERPFRLAPGAHLAFETSVQPTENVAAGRYFVAAQIRDGAGQTYEDVVTIDYQPDVTKRVAASADGERSPELTSASRRVMRRLTEATGTGPADTTDISGLVEPEPGGELGDELVAELQTDDLQLTAGERGQIGLSLRNLAASEIRGEAQLISPHETWPISSPWTQGFAVPPGEKLTLTFDVHPPSDFPGGTYWALVKVMYFGRLAYTRPARIAILPSPMVGAVEPVETGAFSASGTSVR